MPEPSATVLLCVRNGAATLAGQLRALAAQDHDAPWELVLVDNGSTDGSAAILQRWADSVPQVRIVDEPVRGLNRSRNAGVAASRSGTILCCDADDEVTPGWLEAMTTALRRFDVVGAALDPTRINGATPRVDSLQRTELPTVFGRPYSMGAALGFRRTTFDTVGGFDESFDFGSDDADFCLRAQYEGLSIAFEPRAVVDYRTRSRAADVMRQRFGYGRGHERLVAKHAELGRIVSRPLQRWKGATVASVRLVANTPMVMSRETRLQYLASAAHLAGRVTQLGADAMETRWQSGVAPGVSSGVAYGRSR